MAFGSRSLTECQKRYAQIEKELLAIVYGLREVPSVCLWEDSTSGDGS